MTTQMTEQQIKQVVMDELPGIVERDREVQELIRQLMAPSFAEKRETESRFDRTLEELRRDRERQDQKWEEQNRRWEEGQQRFEENDRRWEEGQQRFESMMAELRENDRRWEEENRRWGENQQQINSMLEAIREESRKREAGIGALGARWGIQSEQSFRNGLKGLLEESFGVEVLNVTEYDDEGEVFGRPDQIELDILIHDGLLIICELKSSVSKSDMYTFERKARFYEKRHKREACRLMVISPMVDPRAEPVAEKLGVEVYTHAFDVRPTDVSDQG